MKHKMHYAMLAASIMSWMSFSVYAADSQNGGGLRIA